MTEERETRQKKMIESEIEKTRVFFTAEELHERLQKKDSKLGIATVYRFLKALKKERKLHTYLCERKYLYSKEKLSHTHFICEKCGITTHLPMNKVDFLRDLHLGDICHFQLEVSGVCKQCKNKN